MRSTVRRERAARTWAGVWLTPVDRATFVDVVLRAVRDGDPLRVTFLNPYYARRTAADADLAAAINDFDIVQPDGWGVVYGARLAGIDVPERVAIEDVERPLFDAMARDHSTVHLFGSAPGVADRAAANLTDWFPGLRIAGVHHGWLDVEAGHPGHFDEADARRVAGDIAASGADLVLVGLPTPLQQEFVQKWSPVLGDRVVMTVGAYLDKLAEDLDWYPRWMERARLGWAYRVVREPRRLLGRYTVGAVAFAVLVATEAVRHRRRRP